MMSCIAKCIVLCPRIHLLRGVHQCGHSCSTAFCAAPRPSISDGGYSVPKTCQMISSRSLVRTAYCLINSFGGKRTKATNDVTTPAQAESPARSGESETSTHLTVTEDMNEVSYDNFQHLVETDGTKARLKYVLNEYKYKWYMGSTVPTHLSEEQFKQLLEKKSRKQRKKYLRHLCNIELNRLSIMKEKEDRKVQREADWTRKKDNVDGYTYGYGYNSMFIRISRQYMNRFYAWREANAILYGQSIIIDFGYNDVMNKCENAANQILRSYRYNRKNVDPFYLHFCNAEESNPVLKAIKRTFCNKYRLVNITEKSYLDIFPKEKLVYLTPDARETLDVYDPDAVYIIGGHVDKTVRKPVALAKAKKEGLKCAKLPIDDYVTWKQGQKSLTIDRVFCIMLDFKNTKDWKKAFCQLPKQKVLHPKVQTESAAIEGKT